MTFTLPELPFAKDALEPHMSANTFSYHHEKHHAGYVKKANDAVEGTEYADMSAEEIMKATAGKADKAGVFNNVAQHWNHSFFWECLTPKSGDMPADLKSKIEADFGSVDAFMDEFKSKGGAQFGSGWVWLVQDANGKLSVVKTANAETPLTDGLTPLMTCDVWEHAYYLDYQNARPNFLDTFLNELANWDFVASNLKGEGFKLAA